MLEVVPDFRDWRAHRGNEAVLDYADTCFTFENDLDDWELAAADLIADIAHAGAARGIDPKRLIELASRCVDGDADELLR